MLLQPLRSTSQDGLSQVHATAACAEDGPFCLCCSDQALPGKVLSLQPGGMALVDLDGAIEEVSVELIESAPGDTILVHARVAIARLGGAA